MKHNRYATEREKDFEQLLNRYKLALKVRCATWCRGNTERAKDAYQDILAELWQQMDSWRPDMSRKEESLWVLNVARRVLRSNYGKKKYKVVLCNDVEVFEKNINIEVCNRELIDELKTHLDDKNRMVVENILQGFTINDMAMMYGIEQKAMEKRRHRAIQKLTEKYNELYKK
ncbi:MAG: sigma-70 family RNA polymerase sigma factor [Bacteroidales bacterium]|nr:sigma-70 family RNA polymerase sigma factor [Bacteroidales bacterium]